jgi:outer membrane protein OmpA-like peptidoglycan-associated protein/Tfp pilus assembly protein PilF
MKKVYTLLTKVMIFSLILAFPIAMIGQDDGGDKKEKKEKSTSFSPYWMIMAEIGPSWSHSDLAKNQYLPDFNKIGYNGQLGIGRQFTSVISLYLKGGYGSIKDAKENVTSPTDGLNAVWGRNMSSEATYFEENLNLGINLSNLFAGYRDRTVNVGLHLGVGASQWKSTTYDMDTDIEIANSGDSRTTSLTVPGGVNVDFRVSDLVDLYVDYTYVWVNNDLVDGAEHGAMQVYDDVWSHFNLGIKFKLGGNKVKKMVENFGLVTLQATPDPLEEKGDMVDVTITGTFPPKYFDKNAVMCFNPVLKTSDGQEFPLKTMNFKGENVMGDGTLITWGEGGTFTYTDQIPYDPAMDVSDLVVAPVVYLNDGEAYESCGDALLEGKKAMQVQPDRKVADGVIHTSKYMRHTEVADFAPHGYELETIIMEQGNIYFAKNKHNLNWNLPLNKDEENAAALANNHSNMLKGWDLKEIVIEGWASPEGEETFNQGLSERRAETAENYMAKKLKKAVKENEEVLDMEAVEAIEMLMTANGPDWNGFMQAVEASDIKDKAAIINVINSASQDKREEEIRNMILIYPELEKDLLPTLRRAEISVFTFEYKRPTEEIAEMSVSNPTELTLAELLYAGTLTDDLATKRVIYQNVLEQYPKCYRAMTNLAAVELADGNMDEALGLLEASYERNPESFETLNNMGVYYMMEGDFSKGKDYLNQAKALGGDVDYNMGIVNIFEGNYSDAVSNLSDAKCDYNLGLAQLLNKDYSAAENTFKCVEPKDAETYYLMAIVSARQDNKEMTLDYLGQSIKADPEMATKGTLDREFLKYYTDPAFQALVNAQ